LADGYYNADQLINTLMSALTAQGFNGTAFINSNYQYVIDGAFG